MKTFKKMIIVFIIAGLLCYCSPTTTPVGAGKKVTADLPMGMVCNASQFNKDIWNRMPMDAKVSFVTLYTQAIVHIVIFKEMYPAKHIYTNFRKTMHIGMKSMCKEHFNDYTPRDIVNVVNNVYRKYPNTTLSAQDIVLEFWIANKSSGEWLLFEWNIN